MAFQEDVGWGLACLFIPCVSFYFTFTHWEKSKGSFLTWLAGIGVIGVASLILQNATP